MTSPQRSLLAGLLAATLLFSGCLGSDGGPLSLLSDDGDSDATRVTVTVQASNASGVNTVTLTPNQTLVHNASVERPDGYVPLAGNQTPVDLIHEGQPQTVTLAQGAVPAGTYDGLVLLLASAHIQTATAQTNANESAQANANNSSQVANDANASIRDENIVVPLNLTFDVPAGSNTTIRLSLDAGASTDEGTLTPTFDVLVEQGGQTLMEADGLTRAEGTTTSSFQGPPPAARMTVYASDGERIHEPKFTVEQGIFINSNETALEAGRPTTFSGTESEAVAEGAAIEEYRWDFDDGTTATGQTVSHVFERQGVFEVTLTVEDTYGATAEHMLRMVAYRTVWTDQAVNATFENGTGDWSASASETNVMGTSWEADAVGHDSNVSWHVGTHQCHGNEDAEAVVPCYGPGSSATLTSPVIDLPANWTSSGYSFYLAGSASAGSLTVEYEYGNFSNGNTTDGTAAEIDSLTTWTQFEDLDAFKNAPGSEVQFTFSFSASNDVPTGPGFYMDDFKIGGVDMATEKLGLLSQAGT